MENLYKVYGYNRERGWEKYKTTKSLEGAYDAIDNMDTIIYYKAMIVIHSIEQNSDINVINVDLEAPMVLKRSRRSSK